MPNWPKSEKTMVRLTPAVRTEGEPAAQEERRSLSAINRERGGGFGGPDVKKSHGSRVMKAPIASAMPAMTKASASCFLENLRVFEDGVCTLLGCFLGSAGGGVIVAGI